MKQQQDPTYIKGLDGLRGFSVLIVILFHAALCGPGWIGVQIFFVLSGYLIGGILLNLKDNGASLWQNLKTFELRRIFRIFPVYYLYLLLLIAYGLMRSQGVSDRIWYLLTYTGNYTGTFNGYKLDLQTLHLWSLCVEEQFYCFFPLFILLINKKWVKFFLLSLVLLSPLFRWLYGEFLLHGGKLEFDVGVPVQWHTISQLDAFSFGALMHVFNIDRWPKNLPRIIFALLTLAAVLLNLRFGHVLGTIANYQHVWVSSFLNVWSAFLIAVIVSKGYLHRLFSANWLVQMGKVSYGMYVFHFAFLIVYFKIAEKYQMGFAQRGLLSIATIAILYVFCRLLFQYFEMPFLKLKQKHRYISRASIGKLFLIRSLDRENPA
ncbi:MAG: acyltransferase [Williamsia sp.]|nr:acyltransferase [Williamsia sp.]